MQLGKVNWFGMKRCQIIVSEILIPVGPLGEKLNFLLNFSVSWDLKFKAMIKNCQIQVSLSQNFKMIYEPYNSDTCLRITIDFKT